MTGDRYGRRSNDPSNGRLKRETRAIIIALIIQLAGCLFSAGVLWQKINTTEERVRRVEMYFDSLVKTELERSK